MTDMNVRDRVPDVLTGDDVVHLVNFTLSSNETMKAPRVLVLEARADGSELTSICGETFVPKRNSGEIVSTDNCCRECRVALIDLTADELIKSWWTQ